MEAPDLSGLFPGAVAKPDPIKGGLHVTSFFTYNCLTVSLSDYGQSSFDFIYFDLCDWTSTIKLINV